ncbi:MAG: Na+/H+ antiporter subunit E [Clostridia bacterium]|nr:Na+/H+ antiporter subunit E [Clostridia bacterium]MBR5545034.1 Na+/H+ antiporter subunit E [Clostridia bacterium]
MIILFFLLWLMFNGRFTADAGMIQICIVGVVVAAFAYFFANKALGYTLKAELRIWKKAPVLLAYFFILIKEIIIANFQMMKIVVSKKAEIHPVMIKVKIPLKTNFARVLLANSITLTPGTITAELEGDCFTIHCVDTAFAEGIESSSFVKILERLEK